MASLKDPTMLNIILILGSLAGFIFTVLTFAFAGDIALYTMAVKNDIFWESEYGYTNWDSVNQNGSILTVYHTNANTLETDSIGAMMKAVTAVTIAGSLITLVLIALVFFRKEGGLIHMFKGTNDN